MKKYYKILYVEDNQELVENFTPLLSNLADEVLIANDGLDGYEKFKAFKPDIVISDIVMPKLDGIEMATKIRLLNGRTQIIVTSSHYDDKKLFKAVGLNMVEYLIKPVSFDQLEKAVLKAKNRLTHDNQHIVLSEEHNAYWDTLTSSLFHNEKKITLTKLEKALMILFMKNPNVEIETEDIFNFVWDGTGESFNSARVRTLMKRLRQKIPVDIIKNLYGGRYLITL